MDAGNAILLPLYDVFLRRQNTQPPGIRPFAAQTFVRLQRLHQRTETPNRPIMRQTLNKTHPIVSLSLQAV